MATWVGAVAGRAAVVAAIVAAGARAIEAPPPRGTTTTTLYVNGATGDDGADGSAAHPFRSLQRCHDAAPKATAGHLVCRVAGGVYREAVRISANRVEFRGDPEASVVISGLDVLPDGPWFPSDRCVYRRALPPGLPPISQLFYRGEMMVEARWPNLDVRDGNVGDAAMRPAAWRVVGDGTTYGRVRDAALAVNFSWTGALATLNVGHQWNTWTRTVANHTPGTDSFQYPQDLPGLAGYDPNVYPSMSRVWDGCNGAKCNQYFLSGKLEALDAPGEWFHDVATSTLHFWPPGCAGPPDDGAVEVKARDYAVEQASAAATVTAVTLTRLELLGATLSFQHCVDCHFAALALRFPTYDREIRMWDNPAGTSASTLVSGANVTLRNVTLTQSNNGGLKLSGYNVSVDNCLVTFTDWVGNLPFPPLSVTGNRMTVTRCTVGDFGNAGVVTNIPNVPPAAPGQPQAPPAPMAGRLLEVAYTHIHGGGRVGEDTAALYSGGWAAAGTHWHHNWVHDTTEKCLRFDDQSENTTIHHNVLYNCGTPEFDPSSAGASGVGLVAKGDGHLIYANTIFAANHSEMCLSSCVEKLKPFRDQYPRVVQNAHSAVFNSAARRSTGSCECPEASGPGGNLTAVYTGATLGLADVAHHDYRPTAGSPLVDAGAVVPPYTDGYVGKAPDIGAYERGGEHWLAGCVGLAGC